MDFTCTIVRFKEAVEIAHSTRTGLSAQGTGSQKPAKIDIHDRGLLISMEGDIVFVPWENVRQASFKPVEQKVTKIA